MPKGKVYILTNDSMPGIIKIGVTEGSIQDRMKGLDNTSIPTPFRFYFAIESDRYKEIEEHIHDAFDLHRIRNNREFFKIDPERAVAALKISGSREIKLADEAIDSDGNVVVSESISGARANTRFSFSLINIQQDSELTFTRDETKKCKVVSESEVEYNGERYSLSKLALKLLSELGYNWKSVQGPQFFKYNGKTLVELRRELENNEVFDE